MTTSVSPSSSSPSVICKEVFDDGCLPSAEEINEYAIKIGINPDKEQHLLYLAKEGLMQALPSDWKVCYSDKLHAVYYYNEKTKATQWDHPLDNVYRDLVEKARGKQGNQEKQQQQQKKQQINAIIPTSLSGFDISVEDVSQLDSGIRSLQGNEDLDSNATTNNDTQQQQQQQQQLGMNDSIGGGQQKQFSKMNPFASRFLDMRGGKKLAPLEPIKTSRFEVVKTNPQIGLAMRFNSLHDNPLSGKQQKFKNNDESDGSSNKTTTGFTISGTGAMFLKSNTAKRNNNSGDEGGGGGGMGELEDTQTNSKSNDDKGMSSRSLFMESSSSSMGVSHGGGFVKGILRDSSLTDVRRRNDDTTTDGGGAGGSEDKKSVRFNLDDIKMRSANSPEEDPSSSRKFGPSPEISDDNSVDDNDDDDPWDFIEDDHLNDQQKFIKEIKIVPVTSASNSNTTIKPSMLKGLKPMLKSQISSDELLMNRNQNNNNNNNNNKTSLMRTFSADSTGGDTTLTGTVSKSNSSILDKMKDRNNMVKPLYEDTDSESRASSIRSFIQKSEDNNQFTELDNDFRKQLEKLNEDHNQQLKEMKALLEIERQDEEKRLRNEMKEILEMKKQEILKENQNELRLLELNKTALSEENIKDRQKIDNQITNDIEMYRKEKEIQKARQLKIEDEKFQKQLEIDLEEMKHNHNHQLQQMREEYDSKLQNHKKQLETSFQHKLEEYHDELEKEFDIKRKKVIDEHKTTMNTLQKNHAEILQELERDLKSEEEIIRKEHANKLADMKDKLAHDLEMERQRMRESGEDRLYEKIRCEKRLLEDKYRCLKEKYIRLKTDVKLSLERRNRRREQQAAQQQSLTTTTGSETERSTSNKPSIGNSDNKSGSASTPYSEPSKPPPNPRSQLNIKENYRDKSAERHQSKDRKMGIASKYIKQLQAQYQDDTTSMSQSDTTISNNYPKGRYLPGTYGDNGNSDSETLFRCNQENNNNPRDRQRKKLFSRMKSASTSRLNAENYKVDRPCTPVENLRRQLQKLEDLEDQFPDNTLDTTYHLRYPFSDISNDHAGTSSELEFFKHRIHLERDSVRRAKESLRSQRTNFRARQREIKQRHKMPSTRHTLDQLIQEERELTEMEVNLHRTRALLGEKVIRLRHLEQSLQRIYEKEKPMEYLQVQNKDDATLSDLSSHSSSGFSSTDFASDTNQANINRRKEMYQESSECIQNLEILNVEIREILDILSKQQNHVAGLTSSSVTGHTPTASDLNWPLLPPNSIQSSNFITGTAATTTQPTINNLTNSSSLLHAPQSIPTLADRLETYRQLAAGRMQTSVGGAIIAANTIVSQSPRAVNYTTSLVERTRDLRNWLRQAKNEHEILNGGANIVGGVGGNGTTIGSTNLGQQTNL